jgi:hypothetical protein
MSDLIRNGYGIFRADAWNYYQEQMKQNQDDLEKKRISYTTRERVDHAVEYMVKNFKFDSNETQFLARALTHVMAKAREVKYPGDRFMEVAFPMNTEGGSGLSSLNYTVLDGTGEMKEIGSNATDLPELSASLSETPNPVAVLGGYYGYSQVDLEKAGRSNTPLSARKARMAMKAARQKKMDIAINGSGNLPGMFSYSLTPTSLPNGGWNSGATNDEILEDCLAPVEDVLNVGEDEEASILFMNKPAYAKIAYRPRSATSDTSIAKLIMDNSAVDSIIWSSKLDSITSTTNSITAKPVVLAYPRNEDILEFTLPRDLQQFPVQQQMLQFVIPLLFDTAGLFVYEPKKIAFIQDML